ncbi:ATP-grasp domain-containing protein [Paenibacillus thiaminolyticus]|uniref:ATP-grasp domain-containing protein n=1 Tax=Paenibacillus thiaminolyticus TaxID=49283 RepID=A0AAP9DQX4_PANTH|nr:ATP-grasp domain-containing protein [Paenibacillus thiaminolyticus]MCY9538542.1 ATP-grasp domain-containing protein [Paenibacillus thiaminolyticus]MCY9600596.1 ATP-grasp domain-containing protein [Paenibacillus thiaminolyticus]MCY9608390.1 ATP-grasp domain-containing protein [Paenibacillus thiaminolyticus]MCY9614799.1 ATP-grasp domain-containing protein [Paenibacillus thiaminolyticus]MCY9619909.1 ATP-grasp domain-containing protein [Paenibacillus thiaminolyticus]
MNKQLLFVEANTTGTGMMAIRKARELGFEPVFLTERPERYNGLKELDCRIVLIDTNSEAALIDWVTQESAQDRDIVGIMSTSDYYIESVARLARHFGWIGNSRESIAACRNKVIFREKLDAHQVAQPRFLAIDSMEALMEARSSIPLPCILKPADDSGSNHVRLCFRWDEVEQMTAEILAIKHNARGQATARTVLLEQYIEGPEFSVEMFSWQGQCFVIGITEKRLTGYPYFVEAGHLFPARLSVNVRQEIEQTVERALAAVNYRFGASHTEVKWTPEGCVVIESNARLAGGMIPELVRRSTGIDLLQEQIWCAAGKAPEWPQTVEYTNYAGIHFLVSDVLGTFVGINGIEAVSGIPGIAEVAITAQIGQKVQPPQNFSHRLGYVIVEGNDYEETDKLISQVHEFIKVQVNQHTGSGV